MNDFDKFIGQGDIRGDLLGDLPINLHGDLQPQVFDFHGDLNMNYMYNDD